MATRILIADDHQIVRDGLRSLLEKEDGMEVVGEARNGREAVELSRQLSPGVVIMDIDMPELNGVEATRLVLEHSQWIRVVALSMHSDASYVARMLKAGARGYLLKDCAYHELNAAVRTVLAGNTYLSKGIANVVVDDYVRKLEKLGDSSAVSVLTAKEREVLQLIAEGRTTKVIAGGMNVSVKTIETHRQNIMNKLKLRLS